MALSKLTSMNLFSRWTVLRQLSASASRFSTVTEDDKLPRLITMHNGEKIRGTFTQAEMDRRIKNLRVYMQEEQIDGVLFTSIHNVNYHSDFLYTSFGRPYGLVVTMDDVTSISSKIDGDRPWQRTQTGGNIIYTDWHRDNFWRAVEQKLGNFSGKIGFENDHITGENIGKLNQVLPNATKVDISGPTMQMRMIKSDEEIAHIKEGARIGDVGGAACMEAIDVGVSEYEVALHSTQAMVKEIGRSLPHADLMDTWSWFHSGVNTEGAHNPVTTRKIQKGDILSLNCFPVIAGYYTALERTLFMDHVPSDRHMELWEINCEVYRRGIELLKPGIKCCDVVNELNEIYRQHDLLQYRSFGYGYSFGVLCHYYGREAGLELREDNETVIQVNMVISMVPMITIPEGTAGSGGYREHDILVITKDGNENITNFPVGPEHNIVKK